MQKISKSQLFAAEAISAAFVLSHLIGSSHAACGSRNAEEKDGKRLLFAFIRNGEFDFWFLLPERESGDSVMQAVSGWNFAGRAGKK